VAEFQPFYRGAFGVVLVGLLMMLVACVIAHRARLRLGEQLWVILGIVLLFRLGRFAPIFAILCAPALAMTLPRWSPVAMERSRMRVVIASILALLIVRLFVSFPDRNVSLDHWLNRHGPDTPGYPTAAAAFVEQCVEPRSGRMLNEFTWGGYLAWRLGDRYDVFIDGRTQLYAPDLWRRVYGSESSGVDDLLGSSSADVAVLPRERSRLRAALARLGWVSVYRDARAEVMVPPERIADVSDMMFSR
jgi:hypothetical protein